jgi:hypothetical protein
MHRRATEVSHRAIPIRIYSLGYPSSYWLDMLGIWKANPDIAAIASTLRTTAALPPLQPYGSLYPEIAS